MKRCPECRRDYYDDTLLYCLDDGNALLEGPALMDAPATAILSEPGAVATGLRADNFRPMIIGVAASLVIAGIGYGIYRWMAKSDKPALSFQTAKFTRLTTTGKASGVAISPDGKYVVHIQDDGLIFSPDGNYIYYRVMSQEFSLGALFQLPTLGGAPKKLLENLGTNPISFSPDGRQLAFSRMAFGKEDALRNIRAFRLNFNNIAGKPTNARREPKTFSRMFERRRRTFTNIPRPRAIVHRTPANIRRTFPIMHRTPAIMHRTIPIMHRMFPIIPDYAIGVFLPFLPFLPLRPLRLLRNF